MIPDSHKTSLLIPSQLPEFIRDDDDYSKFVLFLKSYYEWLEVTHEVTDRTKNILNYIDIDQTADEFLNYFYNDFLQYFPKDILSNKKQVIKIAKELYQTKGTPASYKFLFRILYNSDVDFFYTKDVVLRASAGTWYVPKSLRLLSQDTNFLTLNNPKYGSYRIFGETSKSIATVENVLLAGSKTEVFISNIERLFESGEYVHIVDSNNQTVLFNSEPLRAKIVGQISQIKIDPTNAGVLYDVNDPVIVYGGLETPTGHGAIAVVGSTTTGSIQKITVTKGGYGYKYSTSNTTQGAANTVIQFTNLGPGAATPIATVFGLDPTANTLATVSLLPIDYVALKANSNIRIGNTSNPVSYNFQAMPWANFNTKLIDALTFTTFNTSPISSISVDNAGGNISQTPSFITETLYNTEYDLSQSNLLTYGILAPIQILSGGSGYLANDTIVISGGSGYGASANILSLDPNGGILSVSYVYPNGNNALYPLGGMGYTPKRLPTITVQSSTGANATLQVTGVLGDGAVLTPNVTSIGTITSISISDYGQDYVSVPSVSLRVQDLIVTGLSIRKLPVNGDIIYQGSDLVSATYTATVDSVYSLRQNANTSLSIYMVRVFNYNSKPDFIKPLNISLRDISMTLTNQLTISDLSQFDAYSNIKLSTGKYDSSTGVITYGSGTAKANATFLNGLTIGTGQYLDASGQPSSYDVLQNEEYNNYTYELNIEKELVKYKDVLLNLLHPTGMHVIGRYILSSNTSYNYDTLDSQENGHSLSYYTGNTSSFVYMTAPSTEYLYDSGSVVSGVTNQFDFGYETDPVVQELDFDSAEPQFASLNAETQSSNTVYFENLGGANLANFITTDSIITLTTDTTYPGNTISSEVAFVNYIDNFITLKDSFWLVFDNVAIVSGNVGSDMINIESFTDNYNNINDGVYANTANKTLMDIVRPGDDIIIANVVSSTVTHVDYVSNIIYLQNNLTSTINNSLMTISRNYVTSNVKIFNPVVPQYIPEITDEFKNPITTESGQLLLLG